MKRIIAILLSFAPLFAFAQEHQIIGGYLLDGKDSFEELDAAVVTVKGLTAYKEIKGLSPQTTTCLASE